MPHGHTCMPTLQHMAFSGWNSIHFEVPCQALNGCHKVCRVFFARQLYLAVPGAERCGYAAVCLLSHLQCSTRWGLFLICASCTAALSLVLWLLVPETRGLPLEEVQLAWATHWFWSHRDTIKQRTLLPGSVGGPTLSEPAATATATDKGAAAAVINSPSSTGCHVHIDVVQTFASGLGKAPP